MATVVNPASDWEVGPEPVAAPSVSDWEIGPAPSQAAPHPDYAAISRQFEAAPALAPTAPKLPPTFEDTDFLPQMPEHGPGLITGRDQTDYGAKLFNAFQNAPGQIARSVETMATPLQSGAAKILDFAGIPHPETEPWNPELGHQLASGAHQAFQGAMGLAGPSMLAAGAATPLKTAFTLGAFSAGQEDVNMALQKLGLGPEYAAVVGDAAGMLVAAAIHGDPKTKAAAKSTLMHRMADKVAAEPVPETEQGDVSQNGEAPRGTTNPRVVLQKLMEEHSIDHLNHTIATVPGLSKAIESGDLAEAKKLLKPTHTQTVTAATPNPPVASIPTATESAETIELQKQQLLAGTRRVVMFSGGRGQPVDAPGPPGLIKIAHGEVPMLGGAPKNTYWYRSDLIYPSEIHAAEKKNELPKILGAWTMETQGLDTVSKEQLPLNPPVVTARASNGAEVQATATTPEAIPQTVAASQPLVPPGGRVTVETPQQVVAERGGSPAEPPPVSKSEKSTSGELFRGGWDVPLNQSGLSSVRDVAGRNAGQFTRISGGTLGRHAETMGAVSETNPQAGPPEVSEEFNPMNMGALEGEPVSPQNLKLLNDHIGSRFDSPLPGVGKYSGKPGEIPANWISRLIDGVSREIASWKPGEKILIVTSGRDIQAVRAWEATGYKGVDTDILTQKWKTDPGEMINIDPRTGKITDTSQALEGVNILRHGTTDANGGQARAEPAPSPTELLFTPGGAEQLGISPREAQRQAAQVVRKLDQKYGSATPPDKVAEAVFPENPAPEPRAGANGIPPAGRAGPAQGSPAPAPGPAAGVPAAGPESGKPGGPGPAGSGSTSANRTVAGFLREETGTAPPIPGAEAASQFVAEDVAPKIRSFAENTKEFVNAMVNFFVPRRGVRTPDLDEIYKMRGGREAAQVLLSGRLDAWAKRIEAMPIPEQVQFVDRVKLGQPQPDPELQALSDFLRRADDELWSEIAKYKPTVAYLDNHFRVLWKTIPARPLPEGVEGPTGGGPAGYKGPSRKSLQGSRGFLKQHTLDDMSEGIARGGIPYTYNPLHMFEASYADAMKFLTAQRIWEAWGKSGTRKFVKFSQHEKPVGYLPLNDRIAKVYFPVKEGMVNAGEWYVEENAARVLNHMLGRDYLREVYPDVLFSKLSGRAGQALLAVKNLATEIELGMSPFHAVFEFNEAAGSMIGIGLRKIFNLGIREGQPSQILSGLKDIITAPKAGITMAQYGAKARAAFRNLEEFEKDPENKKWLADNPEVRAGVMAYFDGGGKFNMPNDFQALAEGSFENYWKMASAQNKGAYISAGVRFVPHIARTMMKPLFEVYIPNLKIAFFLKEYGLAKAEYADRLASGEMTIGQLERMAVDAVDNRFGEMNFDNLFWDRTMKTAAQIILRSVTWKLGNLRANIGAIAGLKEIARGAKEGRFPLLDQATAWFLGMTLWTAILGTTIHRLATGKLPQDIKDVVYPVIDKASGMRVSLPTYWRDIVHFMHSPGGYIKSSLAGDLGRAADILEDKDFYNVEVFHKDDPILNQAWDITRHMVPMPFSVSSYQQAKSQGGSAVGKAAGFFGFTKAPKYIEQTKAEQLAFDYYLKHRPTGSRTAREAERTKRLSAIRNMIRRGEPVVEQLQEMRDLGLLRPKDENIVRNQARQPELEHSITNHDFTLNEVMDIYEAATPEEKKQVQHAMEHRLRLARNKPDLWDARTTRLAEKYFQIQPYGIPAPPPIR